MGVGVGGDEGKKTTRNSCNQDNDYDDDVRRRQKEFPHTARPQTDFYHILHSMKFGALPA